ncbi:MAG: hypothetical protein OXH00_13655 [Candidatus Poribacteria bacterium]|nr:hypothetical protein [Candidatus Poribacteria bacterium]
MLTAKTKPYTKTLKETMRRKSEILSKAQAFWEVGMTETAQPLWLFAATYEEYIAPMLDALGRELEGALHRISAASCYEKAGDASRAVNLYRAALSGPLREDTRQEVENMLHACLVALNRKPVKSIPSTEKNCLVPSRWN